MRKETRIPEIQTGRLEMACALVALEYRISRRIGHTGFVILFGLWRAALSM